jgi:hypothetical protein
MEGGGEDSVNYFVQYVHRTFPHLPGGALTLGAIFFVLLALWLLHRRTRWGGWMAFFIAIGAYTIPLLTEYHR